MVRVEQRDRVAWVRYSREPGDLLDPEGLRELRRALVRLERDPEVRVLVLAGEPGRFPRQMDPDEGQRMADEAPPIPAGVARLASWLLRTVPALQRLLDLGPARRSAFLDLLLCAEVLERGDQVSVAAIDGPAFGGGMELALCCDLRFCSDGPETFLAQPEVLAGVMAGFGATQRLPRLVGVSRALELLLLCEAVDPQAALALGLVNRVLPAEGFEEAVQGLAARLASRPARAVAATKRAVRNGVDKPLRAGLTEELRQMRGVWASDEARAGLRRTSERIRAELAEPRLRPLPELLRAFEG